MSFTMIFARSYTTALGGVPMGVEKQGMWQLLFKTELEEAATHLGWPLPMTGMKTAAVYPADCSDSG